VKPPKATECKTARRKQAVLRDFNMMMVMVMMMMMMTTIIIFFI